MMGYHLALPFPTPFLRAREAKMTPPENQNIIEERKELIKEVLEAYPEKAGKNGKST